MTIDNCSVEVLNNVDVTVVVHRTNGSKRTFELNIPRLPRRESMHFPSVFDFEEEASWLGTKVKYIEVHAKCAEGMMCLTQSARAELERLSGKPSQALDAEQFNNTFVPPAQPTARHSAKQSTEPLRRNRTAALTEAIRLDPKDVLAFYNRGVAFGENGDWENAILDLTEAIRLDPKNCLAYYNRAWAYECAGEHDKAIADFTEVIWLNENYAKAFSSRGLALARMGQHDRAIADFSEAIRLSPELAVAYFNRSLAYDKKGERSKAEADRAAAKRLGHG